MANTRLSMRKIKEILRLCWGCGLSARQAAASCDVGRTTVKEYLDRAEKAGLSWPLPEDIDEASLENLLFPSAIPLDTPKRNMPPFDYLHKELKRKHMTLQRLWEEYREANPDGYQYSQFCLRYQTWAKSLDIALRQDYKAGGNSSSTMQGAQSRFTTRRRGRSALPISSSLRWGRVTTATSKPSYPVNYPRG